MSIMHRIADCFENYMYEYVDIFCISFDMLCICIIFAYMCCIYLCTSIDIVCNHLGVFPLDDFFNNSTQLR